MKYTLKDYQAEAVDQLLQRLDQAKTLYHRDGEETSFALTATTGAGKTVMAAAAIEALFFGSDRFDFDQDDGAVVLWFSDDPNLNDQTRMRLMDASEKFTSQMLVTVKPPFSQKSLEPGKVYFINTQKFSRGSLLTRGHVDDSEAIPELQASAQPDLQGWTIWETIANTINEDERTVYLVLDEAHRGFNARTSSDKPTIVRRLVNGEAGNPPIPIVWGISATIENFAQAMKAADADKSRRALDLVYVDPGRVQESGLVKDTIVLDIPAEKWNEAGSFDNVLVRRAARKLRESTERWDKYVSDQGLESRVHPLLVLQTPNTPDPDDVGRALDQVFDEYPDLPESSVRHVLGDHSVQTFGRWEVDWIEPQRVEETRRVRVLVAKDGISTGWDCPRAEVLVSFRKSSKENTTHITQLLGRMVRSPLARRVPGDERLNAVDCILPFFDRTTAGKVVKYLTGQTAEMPGGGNKKVLYDARELSVNPEIDESVWKVWDNLPTLTVPQKGVRPVKRLVALAQALSSDGIVPGCLRVVEDHMHSIFDEFASTYHSQVADQMLEVLTVRGQTIKGTEGGQQLTYEEFSERADDRAVFVAFEDAKKAFGADIAISYVNHLVDKAEDEDEDLREAFVRASAMAYVPEVREKVDQEADALTTAWFEEHHAAIRALADERVQEYEEIRSQATVPVRGQLKRPRAGLEDYAEVTADEQVVVAEVVRKHLMADENGEFPLSSLNPWEKEVVRAEVVKNSCIGWYRNPSRIAIDSLGIAYRDAHGNWRSMHPDFIFFEEVDGQIRPSIVDPHGHHLDDAGVKLKGLALFAEEYGDEFERIWAVSKINSGMRILDLKIPATRQAILNDQKSPIEFYQSDIGIEYDPDS